MHDPLKDKLVSAAALDRHLQALVERDVRLGPIRERVGEVPPRTAPRGFGGMAKIICGQQLSVASAAAIWARFAALPGACDAGGFLQLDEANVRAAGMSAGKIRALRAVAEAVTSGVLDFDHIETLTADEAISEMVALKGIGPWTAQVYLLFCAGHPDIFPAGDLALQKAVAHGLALDTRPAIRELANMVRHWAPHRGAASLMFWRYFAIMRDKEGILL